MIAASTAAGVSFLAAASGEIEARRLADWPAVDRDTFVAVALRLFATLDAHTIAEELLAHFRGGDDSARVRIVGE